MLIKVMRPDRVPSFLKLFVSHSMGPDFVDNPRFNIHEAYKETTKANPMFFVLFPGVDPTKDVEEVG